MALTSYPCVWQALCFLLVSACTSRAAFVMPTSDARHSVWVKPITDYSFVPIGYNGTLLVQTDRGGVVVDVCNTNKPCDARISSQGSCVGVTSTCNCLRWIGTLDPLLSTNVTVIRTFAQQCVRVWCGHNAVVAINWKLANVNMSVPSALAMAGESVWGSRAIGGIYAYASVFVYQYFYAKVCNPSGFSADCPASSITRVQILPDPPSFNENDSAAILFFVAALVAAALLCVHAFVHGGKGRRLARPNTQQIIQNKGSRVSTSHRR